MREDFDEGAGAPDAEGAGGTNAEGAAPDVEGAAPDDEGAGGAEGAGHVARDTTVVVQSPTIAAAHQTAGFCIPANNKLFGAGAGDLFGPEWPGFRGGDMFRSALICVGVVVWLLKVADGRQNPPAAAPAAKPLVPVATTTIAGNPDAFIGQTVTVTASVDRVISPTSFTVDQDAKASGTGELVVLVESLSAPPELNSYVTVIGEVVRHEGKAAIRATSVLTAAMLDLVKRPAPTVDPDEAAFDAIMKRINPAFGGIRQAVAAGDGDKAAEQAAILKQGFTETEAFWKKREKADAVKWAADARAHAETLETAVAAGKWDEAKTAVSGMQQTCSACHGAYRQRGEGGYSIRSDK